MRKLTPFFKELAVLIFFIVVAPFWAIREFINGGTAPIRWRHRTRGTEYYILHESVIREHDKVRCVVYRDIETDELWVRPEIEFFDGRFEEVET